MTIYDAKKVLSELNSDFGTLYKGQPEVMKTVNSLMLIASKDGVLSSKMKELMAISISIATKCEGCILFHLNKAIKLKVTRDEVLETIAVAIEMGGGPSSVYGAKTIRIFDQLSCE